MREHTGKKYRRKLGPSLLRRGIALMLALLMVVSSMGIQAYADDSGTSSDTSDAIDLEKYLTDDTTMHITIYIDGTKYTYTPAELVKKGLEVPKGAPVKVELHFDTIYNVKKGQTLEYQLPENLMDYTGANEYGYVWQDTVWEENNAGAEVEAADWTIDETGKLTVTIRDDFFESNKHDTDETVDLFGFNIKFSGSFSAERGENSGNGDNEITFRGDTNGTGAISFVIPFEYKNERSYVDVDKSGEFNAADRTITYTVKVSTSENNDLTSDDVVLTDEVYNGLRFIQTSDGVIYQNVSVTTGTFDEANGIWTIGDMEPGEEQTLTYTFKVSKDYFTNNASGEYIENKATVDFNLDGENFDIDYQECPGTVIIEKSTNNTNSVSRDDDGNLYMTYKLKVTAYGGDVSGITVKDAFVSGVYCIENITDITAEQGTTTNTKNSLEWDVGSLSNGESTTLTYRAYIDKNAWAKGTLDQLYPNNAAKVNLTIKNTANVYVQDALVDTASVTSTLTKTWFYKSGATQTSGDYANKIKYTLYAGSAPVVDTIEYIQDDLFNDTGSYYGSITLHVFNNSGKEVNSYTIDYSDLSGIDNRTEGKSWVIDLANVTGIKNGTTEKDTYNLRGLYYYTVEYYVDPGSSLSVNNRGGIGVEGGYTFSVQTLQEGKALSFNKVMTDYEYNGIQDGKYYFETTVQSDIPVGGIYEDFINDFDVVDMSGNKLQNGNHFAEVGFIWFSEEDINNIKIVLTDDTNTTVLNRGESAEDDCDWYVQDSSEPDSQNAYQTRTLQDWLHAGNTGEKYCLAHKDSIYKSECDGKTQVLREFRVVFPKGYTVPSGYKLVISYSMSNNEEHWNYYSGIRGTRTDGDGVWSAKNRARFVTYNGSSWICTSVSETTITYVPKKEITKAATSYDSDNQLLTWKLLVNRGSNVSGDAILYEDILEGQTFEVEDLVEQVQALKNQSGKEEELEAVIKELKSKITLAYTAAYSKGYGPKGLNIDMSTLIDWENITIQKNYVKTNSDGSTETVTRMTIPLQNLVSHDGKDGFYSAASYIYNNGKSLDSGYDYGAFYITLKTKLTTEKLMSINKSETMKNTATFVKDGVLPDGGVSSEASYTVKSKTLTKEMANKENPAYVQYALNINPDAVDIVSDSDTLEVIDMMSTGMSIATNHTNSFKVYDVTNVSTVLDSSGNVDVSLAQTGEDITSDCIVENITGDYIDGMTDDEVGKPTYKITVPDGKHVVILYWATFEGGDGDSVAISNTASFFYNNKLQYNEGGETSNNVVVAESSSSLFVGPFFYLRKNDQWGNVVPGVTFTLYEVTVDDDGNETDRTALMTKTTDSEETLYFGHRSTDGSSVPQLYKNRLYCLVEESAPAGYAVDTEPYYFEFKEKGYDPVDTPTGVTLHQFISGGTYSFTNEFTPTSYDIPVKKTINGKNIDSNMTFSFSLQALEDSSSLSVYTDEECTEELTTLTAEITGSGETSFPTMYFKETGTYTFSIKENDLSEEAKNDGYSKDDTVYTATITVGVGDDNELVVTDVKYSYEDSGTVSLKDGEVPTFNNTIHLTGTITLKATKEVTNRAKPVQEGEFAFTVSVGGEVIAEKNEDGTTKVDENGKPVKKLFYTKEGGDIDIDIDIDQDDVGTQTYIISEVEGDDPTITYNTAERVRVRVTIAEAGNGRVEATDYNYLTEAVFTNDYMAEGSIKLNGTKKLIGPDGSSRTVREGQFEFVVTEGDRTVATGTTKKGGEIDFTEIYYDEQDIGTHTYVITEKVGKDPFISYSATPVTVTVEVKDELSNGTLTVTQVTPTTVEFTNKSTLIVSTGIMLEVLPYVLVVCLVGGFGAFTVVYRRKRRRSEC